MMYSHMKKLRSTYPKAYILVYPESNMSWVTSDGIRDLLAASELQPLEVVHRIENKETRYGVWTDANVKRDAAYSVQRSLMSGSLCYASGFVSLDDAGSRTKLHNQLKFFRDEVKEPADQVFGKFRNELSGKAPGKKDDLVTCLQLVAHWSYKQRTDPAFIQKARLNGWKI